MVHYVLLTTYCIETNVVGNEPFKKIFFSLKDTRSNKTSRVLIELTLKKKKYNLMHKIMHNYAFRQPP